MVSISDVISIMFMLIPMIFTPMICAGDIKDKTLNYEILTGTKRIKIYLGRVLMAVIVNVIIIYTVVLLISLISSAVYGWGYSMTLEDYSLRLAGVFLPYIRLTAFYAFFSILIMNNAFVYAIGYVFSMLEMLASILLKELFETDLIMYLLSFDAFNRLLVPANYGIGFAEDKDIMVVKDVLQTSTAMHAVFSGSLGTIVFVLLGYAVFRKRDMN